MPDFDNLAAAARLALPLGELKCGTCKHFWRNPQQPIPTNGQPIPIQGECRESLRAVTTPTPNAVANARDKVRDLTVQQLLQLVLPQAVIGCYPPTNEEFPACGHHVRKLEEV
jgi:hypothetical protein